MIARVFVPLLVFFASTSSWAIINGAIADKGMFPSTAVIYDATSEGLVCTGTAIHNNQVLTDAHCLAENGAPYIYMNGHSIPVATGNVVYPKDYSVPGYTQIEPSGFFLIPTMKRRCEEGYEWDPRSKRCINSRKDYGLIQVVEDLIHTSAITFSPPTEGECIQIAGYGMGSLGNFFGGEETPAINEMTAVDPDLRYGYNEISSVEQQHISIRGPAIQIRETVLVKDQAALDALLEKAKKAKNSAPDYSMISFGDSGGAVFKSNGEIMGLNAYVRQAELAQEKPQLEKTYFNYNVVPYFTSSFLRTDTKEFHEGLKALQDELPKLPLAQVVQ